MRCSAKSPAPPQRAQVATAGVGSGQAGQAVHRACRPHPRRAQHHGRATARTHRAPTPKNDSPRPRAPPRSMPQSRALRFSSSTDAGVRNCRQANARKGRQGAVPPKGRASSASLPVRGHERKPLPGEATCGTAECLPIGAPSDVRRRGDARLQRPRTADWALAVHRNSSHRGAPVTASVRTTPIDRGACPGWLHRSARRPPRCGDEAPARGAARSRG